MNRARDTLIVGIVMSALLAACTASGSAVGPASASPDGSAPAGGAGSSVAGATQVSEGGQVTVEATWDGPAAGATFEVKLDTHSVDLDALDLSNAVLRNDRGETLTAEPWTAAKGGHHREGSLTFGGNAQAFLAGARSIELVLSGIGDLPERILRWDVGP